MAQSRLNTFTLNVRKKSVLEMNNALEQLKINGIRCKKWKQYKFVQGGILSIKNDTHILPLFNQCSVQNIGPILSLRKLQPRRVKTISPVMKQ
jgi:hypothetical protein